MPQNQESSLEHIYGPLQTQHHPCEMFSYGIQETVVVYRTYFG